jgi:hypothetical protein
MFQSIIAAPRPTQRNVQLTFIGQRLVSSMLNVNVDDEHVFDLGFK